MTSITGLKAFLPALVAGAACSAADPNYDSRLSFDHANLPRVNNNPIGLSAGPVYFNSSALQPLSMDELGVKYQQGELPGQIFQAECLRRYLLDALSGRDGNARAALVNDIRSGITLQYDQASQYEVHGALVVQGSGSSVRFQFFQPVHSEAVQACMARLKNGDRSDLFPLIELFDDQANLSNVEGNSSEAKVFRDFYNLLMEQMQPEAQPLKEEQLSAIGVHVSDALRSTTVFEGSGLECIALFHFHPDGTPPSLLDLEATRDLDNPPHLVIVPKIACALTDTPVEIYLLANRGSELIYTGPASLKVVNLSDGSK